MKDDKSMNEKIQQYTREVNDIKFKSIKAKKLNSDVEIQRLLNEKFYNPYDVLQLDDSATEEQMKRQFKNYSLVLHPDRCKDARAKDAWHVMQQSYKTLIDPEKRKVYLRIMREAKQRAQFERQKQNKKRVKTGLNPLPQSTFQEQYQEMCLNIFKDLEKKKDHIIKLQQSTYNRKQEDLETKKMVQQFRVLTEEEWERSRDKRVSNWRDFSKKKFVVGSKKSDGAIRPPTVKPESRPHYTVVEEKKINL